MIKPQDSLLPHAAPPFSDDELMERLSRPPSSVAREERPWGFMAGLAGTFALGLVVYLSMSAGRHARAQSTAPASPIPSAVAPPPAPAASPPPPPAAPYPLAQLPPSDTDADAQARLRAPAMVVDLSEPDSSGSAAEPGQTAASGPNSPARGSESKLGPDERFAERVAGAQVDTARATRLANTTLIAPQGTVISAVLETGINSDLPGFVRAVVSRDVSGFDGAAVLIPRGSKLIGEYKSGVANGQSRAFVIWSRLLTPQGVSINLGSPATDREGRNGLSGETNTHFIQRFGAAILLSVISAGLQIAENTNENGTSVNAIVIGSPQQATNVATVALQRDIDIPTTITVPMGQDIRVFVARDLDFSDVMRAR